MTFYSHHAGTPCSSRESEHPGAAVIWSSSMPCCDASPTDRKWEWWKCWRGWDNRANSCLISKTSNTFPADLHRILQDTTPPHFFICNLMPTHYNNFLLRVLLLFTSMYINTLRIHDILLIAVDADFALPNGNNDLNQRRHPQKSIFQNS